MAAPLRWFEDFVVGDRAEFGDHLVDADELAAFARRYDPQPIHVDPVAAAHSPYGGIIASGWHTAAMMMRILVDHWVPGESSLGSPGIEELRWLKPVRAGDRLRVRVTVTDARLSRSRPDRGLVYQDCEVLDASRRGGDDGQDDGLLPHPAGIVPRSIYKVRSCAINRDSAGSPAACSKMLTPSLR